MENKFSKLLLAYFKNAPGTNIIGALRNAMHLIKFVKQIHHENYPIVFFLSDGDPNEEESDPREIIKKISDLNSNAK